MNIVYFVPAFANPGERDKLANVTRAHSDTVLDIEITPDLDDPSAPAPGGRAVELFQVRRADSIDPLLAREGGCWYDGPTIDLRESERELVPESCAACGAPNTITDRRTYKTLEDPRDKDWAQRFGFDGPGPVTVVGLQWVCSAEPESHPYGPRPQG